MQDRNDFIGFEFQNRPTPQAADALRAAAGLRLGAGRLRRQFSETLQRGYVLQEGALEQIPVGATQEQVLIVLGTPSTVATVNGEAFYYISQKTRRDAAFMPHEVIDQRVIAVYFDKDRRVAAAGQLRRQGRKNLRFLVADNPDRRPGNELYPQPVQERRLKF